MASFTDIYKQELKGKGVLSSLGSAALKRTKERLDPRNMLFGGTGILSATGQKIFGKGYSAINRAPVGKKIAESGELKSEALNSLLVSSQRQEAQLTIIAKNTMNSNAMARDMNVMRQNIMKLVTISGGKASRGADMFFKDKDAREAAYESQFKKTYNAPSTSPSPAPKADDGSSSIFGKIITALGPFGVAISALVTGINFGKDIIKGFFGILSDMLPSMSTIITSLRTVASSLTSMLLTPLGLLVSGLAGAGIAIEKFSSFLLNRAEKAGGAKGRELESKMQSEMMLGAMDPMGTSFVTGKNPYTGEKLLTPDDDRIKQAQREHQEKINAERMSSYKSRAGVGRDTSPTREEDSGKKKLLDFIGQKESGSLGYNALVYGNGTPKTADLTGMTLEEVLNYQSGMISRGHASTAVGRYQFTKATLQEFAKKAGVNLSEKFTPEIQDKIAGALLDEVGYEKVIAGKMTMDEFQNRLAGRWASLPRVDNTSQYAGLNGNKVLTSSDTLKNVITASMTASTGSTLASASTTSSDLKMAAATQTTSAPVTIATTNSVNNSQAIVANKAQVNDNSIQAILAII